jgi:hypothetical protein
MIRRLRPGIVFSIILFTVQVVCYNQQFEQISPDPATLQKLPAFDWVLRHFPLNHSGTIGFMFFFWFNCIVSLFIVKLIYRNWFAVKAGSLLAGLAFCAYVVTNIIGRVEKLPVLQSISIEIATYIGSPLLTILLLASMTLTRTPAQAQSHSHSPYPDTGAVKAPSGEQVPEPLL